MKYGIATRLKYIAPFVRFSLDRNIKDPLVRQRLSWMLYIHDNHTVAQASRHFDIPLRTLWYWKSRFDIRHVSRSLSNKSTKPLNCRTSLISLDTVKLIKQIRREHLYYGKTKIQRILKRDYEISVGRSRIQKVISKDSSLKYFGLFKKTRKRRRISRQHMYTVPRGRLKIPGGLVYLDVKHLFLPSSQRVYQFTAIDHATRRLFTKVYPRISSVSGSDFVKYIREELGNTKIQYIGTDNGSEFAGELTKLLSELGINHVFSSPRSPKQNPFVERVIQTTINELHIMQGTGYSIENQQERLDKYTIEYNTYRPHSSLELETPMERYVKLSKSLTM